MLVFLLTWVRGDIICIPKGTQGHISLFPAPREFLKKKKKEEVVFSTSSQPVQIIHMARNPTGSHLRCYSGSPTLPFLLGDWLSYSKSAPTWIISTIAWRPVEVTAGVTSTASRFKCFEQWKSNLSSISIRWNYSPTFCFSISKRCEWDNNIGVIDPKRFLPSPTNVRVGLCSYSDTRVLILSSQTLCINSENFSPVAFLAQAPGSVELWEGFCKYLNLNGQWKVDFWGIHLMSQCKIER